MFECLDCAVNRQLVVINGVLILAAFNGLLMALNGFKWKPDLYNPLAENTGESLNGQLIAINGEL